MEELRCLHRQPLCLEHGGSGRFLLTRCYCTSALLSLGGAKCQDKFKCQASREACQSGVSILCGAQISHCRTGRQRSWLPFDVHAEHRRFASPRDHGVCYVPCPETSEIWGFYQTAQ